MIRNLIGGFEEMGLVADRPGKGTHRNKRIEENADTVRDCLNQSLLQPIGHFQNDIAYYFKVESYEIQIVQTLLP